jgi:hypothetical protein
LVTANFLLSAQTMLYRRVPLEKPPDVLAEGARNILKSVGYSEPPVDTAMGFYEGTGFLRYIADHDKSKTRWDNLDTGAFVFWHRGSPPPLEVVSSFNSPDVPVEGFVWTHAPPLDVSGMTLVSLSPLGRLTQFVAVPPLVDRSAGAAPLPDWAPLFSAAGIDPSSWAPARPIWTPPVYSDARAAWTGSLPERPDIPVRIEAAAYRGKPVYFELIGPWIEAERTQQAHLTTSQRAFLVVGISLVLSMLAGCAMLARRNLRLGRGDRRGASRLAAIALPAVGLCYLAAHHVPNSSEFGLFLLYLSVGLAWSCVFWVVYIALEPYVRRRWPATLVSWNRLLAGGFRDPLVGRDVLVGCLLASFASLSIRVGWFVPSWLGKPPTQPLSGPQLQFLGVGATITTASRSLGYSLFGAFLFLFVLFLFRTLLRREWAAVVAFVLFLTVLITAGTVITLDAGVFLVATLIANCVALFLIIRLGFLVQVACFAFQFCLLENFPLTANGSAWYAGLSLTGTLLMAAMAFYGFYTSLGGRPVFGNAAIE